MERFISAADLVSSTGRYAAGAGSRYCTIAYIPKADPFKHRCSNEPRRIRGIL
jgi:hypothetical protein